MTKYKIMFNVLLVTLLFTSLTACNFLSRHPDSGYMNGMNPIHFQLEKERQAYKESHAREELGLGKSLNLTENQNYALKMRLMVQQEEQNLTTYREKKQYYQYKPLMRSDQERLYFLRLENPDAKEKFIHQRGIASMAQELPEEITTLIEEHDISIGMTQKAVLESWGDPDLKEVAGNPVYGNERWKYSKYVSSEAGYLRENRFVYFENGVVSGWESF